MARPVTIPVLFASESTYDAGSGVPAGLVGTSVRVSPPTSLYEFGFVPGGTFQSQWINYVLGLTVDWVKWVSDGSSALARSAHVVETTSNGKTSVMYLTLGDGSGTALNADNALTIIADGTKYGITATNALSNTLQLFKGVTNSTSAGCAYFETSASSKKAVEAVATSGYGVHSTVGTGGQAVTAVATTGYGVHSTATTGYAVYGVGSGVAAIYGLAGASGGIGVQGLTDGSAISSGIGVKGEAFADGIGVKAIGTDGHAIVATCTGAEDVIKVLATGTGAALMLAPQSAPADQRAGQIWTENLGTLQAALRFCTNSTGLSSPYDTYVHVGLDPEYRFCAGDTFASVAHSTTDHVLASATMSTHVNCTVSIRAEMMIKPNTIGAMPKQGACLLELWDDEASATIVGTTVDVPADGTSRCCWVLSTPSYALTAGAQTIQLRVTTAAAASGTLEFYDIALFVQTSTASVG